MHQLVLQDNVFAIFDGLGTPTHLAVLQYLNSSKVPDVFVASGCTCWNNTSADPYTTGWQIDYVREGKILGNYIKQHFAGKKIGYFYQDDEFGMDGVKGLDDEIPSSQVVARQSYNPAVTNVAPQVTALKAAGAQVVVSFSVPAFTALLKLNSLKLSFSPQLVVSNVGSDPITLAGLLESYAKQGGATVSGNQLTQGIITDAYQPSLGSTGNSWIQLYEKIHSTYLPKLPLDGNVAYGIGVAYTFVQAMFKAGRNPTRQDLMTAINGGLPQGPVGGAVRLLGHQPRRRHRRVHGRDQERRAEPDRAGPGHRRLVRRGDHHLLDHPAAGPGQRDTIALTCGAGCPRTCPGTCPRACP